MKIAITGASGHIGSNLCKVLIEAGHDVTALIQTHNKGIENLNLHLLKGDLFDVDSLKKLVDGAEIVFHLAASIAIYKRDPLAYKINVQGTKNILNAIQGTSVRRFIHFSSIHAFRHEPFNEELNESRPLDIDSVFDYNRSKAIAAKMVLQANGKNIETLVLSPTAVIGPYDFAPSLLANAIIRFYKGKTPALVPGGYDWVDVRDICFACINAMDKGQPGINYILNGHWKSLKEMAGIIHELGGAKPPFITIPSALARASAPILNIYSSLRKQMPLYTNVTLDAVSHSHKNISGNKAIKELGYRSRPFKESMSDTIKWLKNEHFI